jgi:hypothetical protein
MMACHHATGGDARQEFIDWSTSDPEYANHAELIGRRWDSLHADKAGGVTARTLDKILADHDVEPLPPVVSEDEFGELPDETEPPKKVLVPSPYVWKDPASIPQRRYLYGNVYQRGYVTLTSAAPGVGKSAESRAECAAIASGKALLGIEPTERAKVWYWNGEDPLDELERGFAAIRLHFNLQQADLVPWLFTDSGRTMPIKLATLHNGNFKVAKPIAEALIGALRSNAIGLLCVDPFVTTHTVNENDNAQMNAVMDEWRYIADTSGAAIGLVHHTRKLNGEAAGAEASRGASAVNAAARIRRVINPMSANEAARAGVPEGDHFRYFSIDYRGSSFIPGGSPVNWYRFTSVNLGNGECGDGDEVGVVEQASLNFDLRPGDTEAALEAVRKGGERHWRKAVQSPDWIGHAIAPALGLSPDDKRARVRLTKIIEEWLQSGVLIEVQGKDKARRSTVFIKAGEVSSEEDWLGAQV